jgi:MoxR-like ATPase
MGAPRIEDAGIEALPAGTIGAAGAHASALHASEALVGYVLGLAEATRRNPQVALGLSTRAVLALVRAARIEAAARGAEFVAPDDVKAVVPLVVPHRLVLTPEATLDGVSAADVARRVLEQVPIPR